MKAADVILSASLLANVLLASTFVLSDPTETIERNVTTGSPEGHKSAAEKRPSAASESRIQGPGSYAHNPALDDARVVARALTAANYSPEAVQRAIKAAIGVQYRDLMPVNSRRTRWQPNKPSDPNARAARAEIFAEQDAEFKRIMAEMGAGSDATAQIVPAKAAEIKSIERALNAQLTSQGLEKISSGDRSRLLAEYHAALESLLTPEELRTYLRYNDNIVGSDRAVWRLQAAANAAGLAAPEYEGLADIAIGLGRDARRQGLSTATFQTELLSQYRAKAGDGKFLALASGLDPVAYSADEAFRAADLPESIRAEKFLAAAGGLAELNSLPPGAVRRQKAAQLLGQLQATLPAEGAATFGRTRIGRLLTNLSSQDVQGTP